MFRLSALMHTKSQDIPVFCKKGKRLPKTAKNLTLLGVVHLNVVDSNVCYDGFIARNPR